MGLPIAVYFDAPSSVFLIAAMGSSLCAGRKAGLLAMALLALLFKVFFLPTRHPALVAHEPIRPARSLLNLVSNAIEAMHVISGRPRVLKLQLGQQGSDVATAVIDTGVGVSDFDKIFETFVTTKESGIGIGLPICRSIVEAAQWPALGFSK